MRIWDYQTKTCIQVLEGHTENVTSVLFHPKLPIIVTGSEDGTIRIWHSVTYRCEMTLNYGSGPRLEHPVRGQQHQGGGARAGVRRSWASASTRAPR